MNGEGEGGGEGGEGMMNEEGKGEGQMDERSEWGRKAER